MAQQPHAPKSSDGAPVKHPLSLCIRDGMLLGGILTEESLRRAWATRHRAGTGISGKSEFPAGWSDDKIMREISDVATDPASKVTVQGRDTVVEGRRDGVDIRVIMRDGRIVTGYPTNLPKNP